MTGVQTCALPILPKLSVEAARRDMIADRASDEQVRSFMSRYHAPPAHIGSCDRPPSRSRSTSPPSPSLARTSSTPTPPSDSWSPTASPPRSEPFLPTPFALHTYILFFFSAPSIVQIVLATAHPAKFNAAVSDALSAEPTFDFQRDIMPKEFDGLLDLPRRVYDCRGDPEDVKRVIVREVAKLVGDRKEAETNGASI